MKMKLKNFTPAIVLGAICLIVAAILAAVNHFTAPVIADNERLARTASLREVFGGDGSGADFDLPLAALPAGTPETVKEIYEEKNGKGYAVIVVIPKGYEGEIDLTVGVDADGKLTGVSITKYEDSLGKSEMGEAVKSLVGKGEGELGDGVLVSGATFSSKAVKAGIEDALSAVGLVKSAGITAQLTSLETASEPTVDDIIAKGMELMPDAQGFLPVDISEAGLTKGVKNIFRETSGKGYLVFCRTRTQYNPRETEFVMVLDKDYNVSGFDITYWTLSPSYQDEVHIYGDHEDVKALEESFLGKNQTNVGTDVDLVTKATSTSYNIYNAVTEVLDYLDADVGARVLASAKALMPDAEGFELVDTVGAGFSKGVKLVYRETSGKGYAVYCRTGTQYNPDETRFVFTLDESFTVTGFDLWRWSTGIYDGATFPDAPEVDRLEKSFVGVNVMNSDLKVDLVSGATGTTNNVKAAVLEAINYLDPPPEINAYKIAATVIFFAGIAALGAAIYFERRRRV